MKLEDLLRDVQTVAVVCNQWGDTGKGKFSDYFASQWADVTARGTGGNNAGHTVVIKGKEKVFHLMPTGILNDSEGKITVMGNGMVIDVPVLCQELDELDAENLSYNNLRISKDANIIMPFHVDIDKAKDQSQKTGGIGSTGRGIGPCYADKVGRRGIVIGDLFDRDILSRKIDKVKEMYEQQITKATGIQYQLNKDEIIDSLIPFAERIKPFVGDTVSEMHEFMRTGKKILLEGAQGLLLSIEHGTYPYVTSSDCSLNGTASGVGLSAKMIDLPLGVVKFPFMTRVGAGPFPTEFGGKRSESYCAGNGRTKEEELRQFGIPYEMFGKKIKYNQNDPMILEMINSSNEFIQGVGIRLTAGEYGATTGRPRRTGWTDAVIAKYAVGINGPLMILTKPDSLSGASQFRLAYGYKNGEEVTENFSKSEQALRQSHPVYKSYEGYGDINGIRNYDSLPSSLRKAIGDFEDFTGGRVAIVSVGADREETIVR